MYTRQTGAPGMSVVCISRGSFGYGKEVAERLAAKMDATCISRESITDSAAESGIPVGKLEMAVLKNRPLSEAMGVVRDLFRACVAANLSERALDGDIVYHGRSGHLVLPDLSSVLRVRTIDDAETRIQRVMTRLGLSREKAKQYARQVDEDRERWVRRIYNVAWDDPFLYDITLNAAHLSMENAASVLVNVARLPEFQTTPASTRILRDILLASRCRLAIGKDDRTRNLAVTVQASKGLVTVSYPPHQSRMAERIPAVLEKIEGIESLACTMATTNILYVGDRFDPTMPDFNHLVEIAEKWNAAVDLAQLRDADEARPHGDASAAELVELGVFDGSAISRAVVDGDVECEGGGVPETIDRLVQMGRAGRYRCFRGGVPAMLKSLSPATEYSLIVVGDVFSDREKAAARLRRNVIAQLAERFRVPVLGSEELKSQYLFGPRQAITLVTSLAAAAVVYMLVFSFQVPVLEFLSFARAPEGSMPRIVAAVAVALLVPAVAFSVGSFYKNILKLVKLE